MRLDEIPTPPGFVDCVGAGATVRIGDTLFRVGETLELAEHMETMGYYYTPELRETVRRAKEEAPSTSYTVTVTRVDHPNAPAPRCFDWSQAFGAQAEQTNRKGRRARASKARRR